MCGDTHESCQTGDMADMSLEETTAEVDAWLDANWDPDLTVGEWWQLLADANLSHAMLPENAGGRGWSRAQAQSVGRAMAVKEVLGPPAGLGYMLAAPTIAAHGTQDQIDRLVKPILNGTQAWCQLFSEPQAGSDLAGLQTKAVEDGDEWVVNGQKVWTSGGQIADMGMLIARTDPSQPKHKGISYFAIPMHQEGVDVRPLREMTGRSFFNEVFLSDARASAADLIGGRGDGWRVTNTTLGVERASIGAGSTGVASTLPGTVANRLGLRAGDEAAKKKSGEGGVPGVGMGLWHRMKDLAVKLGREQDPVLRDELMTMYSRLQINRYNLLRAKAGTGRTGGEGNIAKLTDAELIQDFRDLGMQIIGADGMLRGESMLTDAAIAEIALFSPAPAIYGGTNEVQKNILGERVLGLPKEPGPARDTPFEELPRNV